MDTQLNALPTLAVLARTVSGCLNSAFLDISQHFTGHLFRPWIPSSARDIDGGRVGDASCVPVILEAIRDAAPPTLQVGMDALRALPGEDVTRALIDAYPKL